MDTPVRPDVPEAFIYGAPMQWKSNDGTVWDITDMADEHLENCIRFMEERAIGYLDRTIEQYVAGPHPQGDMAQLAFDQEFDELLRQRYLTDDINVSDPHYSEKVKENALAWLREEYPPYIAMKAVLKHRQDEMDRRLRQAHETSPTWLREFDPPTAEEVAKFLVEKVDMHICSDCGGDERWIRDAAAALNAEFGFRLEEPFTPEELGEPY